MVRENIVDGFSFVEVRALGKKLSRDDSAELAGVKAAVEEESDRRSVPNSHDSGIRYLMNRYGMSREDAVREVFGLSNW